MWVNIVIALVVSVLLTIPIIWLLGWRRPGAGSDESDWLSGLFLFVLLFLATWAITAWAAPWGPAVWGVSWLLVLIVAAFVALLVLVASPVPRYGEAGVGATASEGVGILFWVLILLLLFAAIVGGTSA
jgi:hypothetical protein